MKTLVIDDGLHLRLKMAAVSRRLTITELLQSFIEDGLRQLSRSQREVASEQRKIRKEQKQEENAV